MKKYFQVDSYKNINSSFIHFSQTLVTVQVSTNRTDKQTLFIHTVEDYSAKKKRNKLLIDITMWIHLQNIKEVLHKGIHAVWFYRYDILEWAKLMYGRTKLEQWLPLGRWGQKMNGNGAYRNIRGPKPYLDRKLQYRINYWYQRYKLFNLEQIT